MKISAASGKEPIQIALLCCLLTVWEASAANENAAAFKALCRMYRTLKGKLPQAAADLTDVDSEMRQLENLKFSSLLSAAYDNRTFGDVTDPEHWSQRKKEIESQGEAGTEGTYRRYPDSEAKQAAHNRIVIFNRKAKELKSRLDRIKTTLTLATTDAANHLNAALYGGNKTKDTDDGAFAARADACIAAGNAVGKSLVSDFACVCAATTADDVCCKGCANTNYANAGTNNPSDAKAVWQAVKSKCEKLPTVQQATKENLQAALESVIQEIGGLSSNANSPYMLGGGSAGTCTGATDHNQACVDYSQKLQGGGAASIPWMKQVTDVIRNIRLINTASTEAQAAKEAIKNLATLAWTTYDLIPAKPGNNQHDGTEQQAQATAANSNQGEECNKQQSRDKCNDPCTWNENSSDRTKRCTLDPVKATKQQTQAAGAGDTPTGPNTNTTGNNSFIINKAPLLLAVLLF
uniref:Variant surface glycoprotein 1125.421 n=1 Tax=Trypanosoma brucei TaxID=5691 RepID=A0A1J0R5V5_9TRYP|nr:variant surface glycoprotein 1125.421 [Trypanosoma brucei]